MGWTAPRTWVDGEVVTRDLLNQHLRDNLLETEAAKAAAAGDTFHATSAAAFERLPLGGSGSFYRTSDRPYWGGKGPFALTEYDPGSDTTISLGGSFADLDATNLVLNLAIPASGNLLVRLSCYYVGSGTDFWSLREGSNNVTGSVAQVNESGTKESQHELAIVLTGFTAGDRKTWKWGGKTTSSSSLKAGPTFGAAVMAAWEL
jgi:hypothetical protein